MERDQPRLSPVLGQLPISAVVGSCDEGQLLGACLKSLQFCREILVFDLDCGDDTAAIARAAGARVIRHPRLACMEPLHCRLAEWVAFDWVLLIDPDERVNPALARDLVDSFPSFQADTAVVYVPWQFYFGNHRLAGTVWGGEGQSKKLLVNRHRAIFSPQVHAGPMLIEGFHRVSVPRRGDNVLQHYWMTDWGPWLKKHQSYIRQVGRNEPFPGWANAIKAGPRSFVQSFFWRQGYRDGLTGLFLSLFFAWYRLRCLAESYRVQRVAAGFR